MLSEILGELGWNTYMVGKWHLCPDDEMNVASTRRNWPTGRGFERWYGFLGAETNQWYPDLVYDNHPVDQPKSPEEGYHFTEDITDKAIEFIKDAKVIAPEKPFFLYYAPGRGARAAPRAEGVGRPVQGPVRHGLRGDARADPGPPEGAGHRPGRHRAAPDQPDRHRRRPAPGPDGSRSRRWTRPGRGTRCRPRSSGCSAGWPRCTPGSWRTPTTRSGGCSTTSRRPAQRENTMVIVVSDNGASGEGGPNGSVNEMKFVNGIPDDIADEPRRCSTSSAARRPTTTTPTAGRWRSTRRSRCGSATSSTAAPPTRASSPGRRASTARGELRDQYHHAIDIVPTILDVLGVEPPATIKGHVQSAVRRRQHALQLRRRAPRRATRATQFYSMLGSRGDLARRLEGGHHPPDAQRLEPLQRRRVGAVPHRRRPRGAARPGGRAPGEGPGAGEPVVRRGRRQRRLPARRPLGAGDHPDAAAACCRRRANRYVYYPGHRRGARSRRRSTSATARS